MDEYISKKCIYDIIYKHQKGLQNMGVILTLDTIDKEVQKVPAADVQPVKRGKWEHEHYNEQIECYVANCSECGYESTDKYRITSNHRCCEYCSTRMDLKE